MQTIKDAATLGVLILLALTVRISPVDNPLDFNQVHASTAAADTAVPTPEPFVEATEVSTRPLGPAFPVAVGADPRSESVRKLIGQIGERRIVIVLEAEEAEATADAAEEPAPPVAQRHACVARQAQLAC